MATKLPKRFIPLLDQARTESELRYGGQESGLQGIFDQATRQYSRQAQAQRDMGMSLLGTLGRAGTDLTKAYTDAGLTPTLIGQLQGTPTGQRLAGELASGQADIINQRTGAVAGQQYIQQNLADKYREDVGDINRQATQLAKERGLFQQQTLDQLIAGDRASRHDANLAAAKLAAENEQAGLDRDSAFRNALISQGLLPDKQGNLQPLPGGKADPNAPGNKPKPRQWAPLTEQAASDDEFSRLLAEAQDNKEAGETRDVVADYLRSGVPAGKRPVFKTVKIKDQITGKVTGTKQQRVLNPDGTPKTVDDPGFAPAKSQLLMQAALEVAYDGHLSKQTQRLLQARGIQIGPLGVTTAGEYAAEQRRTRAQQRNPSGTAGTPERAPGGARGHI